MAPRNGALTEVLHNQEGGSGNNTVEWKFEGLTDGVTYEVSATWVGGDNRASNAPYTIFNGGTQIDLLVDQRPGPGVHGDIRRRGGRQRPRGRHERHQTGICPTRSDIH